MYLQTRQLILFPHPHPPPSLLFDRLQGIVASMSRIPTFWRRFRNLVKVLYIEAIQAGASANHIGGILEAGYGSKKWIQNEDRNNGDESVNEGERRTYDNGNVV
jgi:hypothetical protein